MGFYTVFYSFFHSGKTKEVVENGVSWTSFPICFMTLLSFSITTHLFLYLILPLFLSLLQLSPQKLYQIHFLSPHTSVFFRFNHILINSLFKHKLTISVIPISCHNSDSRSLSFLLSLYDASNHNSRPHSYWSSKEHYCSPDIKCE